MKEKNITTKELKNLIERLEYLEQEIDRIKHKPKQYSLSQAEKQIKRIQKLMGGELLIKVFIGTDNKIRIHDVESLEDHIQNIINQNFFDTKIKDMTG